LCTSQDKNGFACPSSTLSCATLPRIRGGNGGGGGSGSGSVGVVAAAAAAVYVLVIAVVIGVAAAVVIVVVVVVVVVVLMGVVVAVATSAPVLVGQVVLVELVVLVVATPRNPPGQGALCTARTAKDTDRCCTNKEPTQDHRVGTENLFQSLPSTTPIDGTTSSSIPNLRESNQLASSFS
jgi:hypothetical protein